MNNTYIAMFYGPRQSHTPSEHRARAISPHIPARGEAGDVLQSPSEGGMRREQLRLAAQSPAIRMALQAPPPPDATMKAIALSLA